MKSEKASSVEPTYKIILIGDCGVGKTTIFERYIYGKIFPDQSITTIDFRYKNIKVQDKNIKLCIWDTAGQQKFRSIVATYFKSCEGVLLVFDLSNRESWHNVKTIWYEMALKNAPQALFILLGNSRNLESKVSIQQITLWCKQRGMYYIPICPTTNESIEKVFFTLAVIIDNNQEKTMCSSFHYRCSISNQEQIENIRRSNNPKTQSFILRNEQKKKKRQKCCQ